MITNMHEWLMLLMLMFYTVLMLGAGLIVGLFVGIMDASKIWKRAFKNIGKSKNG